MVSNDPDPYSAKQNRISLSSIASDAAVFGFAFPTVKEQTTTK